LAFLVVHDPYEKYAKMFGNPLRPSMNQLAWKIVGDSLKIFEIMMVDEKMLELYFLVSNFLKQLLQ
jgi:hypothetical protein